MTKKFKVKQVGKEAIDAVADSVDVKALIAQVKPDELTREALILRAQVAYLTDPNKRNVELFWTVTEGTVSLDEFVKRANREKWQKQRDKISHQIRGEIIRRMGKEIVADQIREARETQNIRNWLYDYIKPNIGADGVPIFRAEVKSMEGILKAYRDITLLLQLYRQTVSEDLAPHTVIDVQTETADSPFTSEELVDVAHEVLKRRIGDKEDA
ncbi:MAG TPA: hypothetical protein VM537_21995 [Anaerolineae bacterium]|nr:hypothetical protein [Anaerolineae bacterium]